MHRDKPEIVCNDAVSDATKTYAKALSDLGYKLACVASYVPDKAGIAVTWHPALTGQDNGNFAKDVVEKTVESVVYAAKEMCGVDMELKHSRLSDPDLAN